MSYKIFIYTALPCEAKPLVEHFKLKKRLDVQAFAVYEHDTLCLTVTGVGKSAMAAGVAYTQALFNGVENPILINIGIAGHRDYAIGDLYLVDKIIDADSQKPFARWGIPRKCHNRHPLLNRVVDGTGEFVGVRTTDNNSVRTVEHQLLDGRCLFLGVLLIGCAPVDRDF